MSNLSPAQRLSACWECLLPLPRRPQVRRSALGHRPADVGDLCQERQVAWFSAATCAADKRQQRVLCVLVFEELIRPSVRDFFIFFSLVLASPIPCQHRCTQGIFLFLTPLGVRRSLPGSLQHQCNCLAGPPDLVGLGTAYYYYDDDDAPQTLLLARISSTELGVASLLFLSTFSVKRNPKD